MSAALALESDLDTKIKNNGFRKQSSHEPIKQKQTNKNNHKHTVPRNIQKTLTTNNMNKLRQNDAKLVPEMIECLI